MNKKINSHHPHFFFIYMSFTILASLRITNNAMINISGIASNIKEIRDILTGFQSFVSKIISFTSMIGFNTILLLIAVIIISTALSIIGIRKGKISFFTSLIIADIIWIMWSGSFSPVTFSLIVTIMKSNAILITPFVLAFIVRLVYPPLASKLVEKISALFRKNKGYYTKKQVSFLADDVQEKFTNFQKELLHDLIHSTNSKKIYISKKSLDFKKELENTLSKIK